MKKTTNIEEKSKKSKEEEEKMDMKKRAMIAVIVVGIIAVLCIVMFGRGNENGVTPNPDEKVDNTPINKTVDLSSVFEEIEKIEGMKKETVEGVSGEEPIENPEEPNKKEIKDEENIDFGNYNVLEKKAIVKTTDEYVNEVWMIKLGNINQQEHVARLLGNRVQKLRNAFAEDAMQTAIINKAIIKQENGIVIMIISPNEKEIEKAIAEAMK